MTVLQLAPSQYFFSFYLTEKKMKEDCSSDDYIVKDDRKLLILLIPPPQCWDSRRLSWGLVLSLLVLTVLPRASCISDKHFTNWATLLTLHLCFNVCTRNGINSIKHPNTQCFAVTRAVSSHFLCSVCGGDYFSELKIGQGHCGPLPFTARSQWASWSMLSTF